MKAAQIVQVTETGDVTTRGAYLLSVVLTPGSDAASVVVKAGGSSGTTILTLAAVANGASVATGWLGDVPCTNGIHATMTGTNALATVVYA